MVNALLWTWGGCVIAYAFIIVVGAPKREPWREHRLAFDAADRRDYMQQTAARN